MFYQEGRDYDFDDDLDLLVGKKIILKLKRNEYNKKYPSSSISMAQYTICEDLLEQFMKAFVKVCKMQESLTISKGMIVIEKKFIWPMLNSS